MTVPTATAPTASTASADAARREEERRRAAEAQRQAAAAKRAAEAAAEKTAPIVAFARDLFEDVGVLVHDARAIAKSTIARVGTAAGELIDGAVDSAAKYGKAPLREYDTSRGPVEVDRDRDVTVAQGKSAEEVKEELQAALDDITAYTDAEFLKISNEETLDGAANVITGEGADLHQPALELIASQYPPGTQIELIAIEQPPFDPDATGEENDPDFIDGYENLVIYVTPPEGSGEEEAYFQLDLARFHRDDAEYPAPDDPLLLAAQDTPALAELVNTQLEQGSLSINQLISNALTLSVDDRAAFLAAYAEHTGADAASPFGGLMHEVPPPPADDVLLTADVTHTAHGQGVPDGGVEVNVAHRGDDPPLPDGALAAGPFSLQPGDAARTAEGAPPLDVRDVLARDPALQAQLLQLDLDFDSSLPVVMTVDGKPMYLGTSGDVAKTLAAGPLAAMEDPYSVSGAGELNLRGVGVSLEEYATTHGAGPAVDLATNPELAGDARYTPELLALAEELGMEPDALALEVADREAFLDGPGAPGGALDPEALPPASPYDPHFLAAVELMGLTPVEALALDPLELQQQYALASTAAELGFVGEDEGAVVADVAAFRDATPTELAAAVEASDVEAWAELQGLAEQAGLLQEGQRLADLPAAQLRELTLLTNGDANPWVLSSPFAEGITAKDAQQYEAYQHLTGAGFTAGPGGTLLGPADIEGERLALDEAGIYSPQFADCARSQYGLSAADATRLVDFYSAPSWYDGSIPEMRQAFRQGELPAGVFDPVAAGLLAGHHDLLVDEEAARDLAQMAARIEQMAEAVPAAERQQYVATMFAAAKLMGLAAPPHAGAPPEAAQLAAQEHFAQLQWLNQNWRTVDLEELALHAEKELDVFGARVLGWDANFRAYALSHDVEQQIYGIDPSSPGYQPSGDATLTVSGEMLASWGLDFETVDGGIALDTGGGEPVLLETAVPGPDGVPLYALTFDEASRLIESGDLDSHAILSMSEDLAEVANLELADFSDGSLAGDFAVGVIGLVGDPTDPAAALAQNAVGAMGEDLAKLQELRAAGVSPDSPEYRALEAKVLWASMTKYTVTTNTALPGLAQMVAAQGDQFTDSYYSTLELSAEIATTIGTYSVAALGGPLAAAAFNAEANVLTDMLFQYARTGEIDGEQTLRSGAAGALNGFVIGASMGLPTNPGGLLMRSLSQSMAGEVSSWVEHPELFPDTPEELQAFILRGGAATIAGALSFGPIQQMLTRLGAGPLLSRAIAEGFEEAGQDYLANVLTGLANGTTDIEQLLDDAAGDKGALLTSFAVGALLGVIMDGDAAMTSLERSLRASGMAPAEIDAMLDEANRLNALSAEERQAMLAQMLLGASNAVASDPAAYGLDPSLAQEAGAVSAAPGPDPRFTAPTAAQLEQAQQVLAGTGATPSERAAATQVLLQAAVNDAREAIYGGRTLDHPGMTPDEVFSAAELKSLCQVGQAASYYALAGLGIEPSALVAHQANVAFGGAPAVSHGFLVAELPDGRTYLVDPTFRQFVGGPESPLGAPGAFLYSTPEGTAFANELLSNGYVELTDANANLYGQALRGGDMSRTFTARNLSEPTTELELDEDDLNELFPRLPVPTDAPAVDVAEQQADAWDAATEAFNGSREGAAFPPDPTRESAYAVQRRNGVTRVVLRATGDAASVEMGGDFVASLRADQDEGWETIGIVHTHPGGELAAPSGRSTGTDDMAVDAYVREQLGNDDIISLIAAPDGDGYRVMPYGDDSVPAPVDGPTAYAPGAAPVRLTPADVATILGATGLHDTAVHWKGWGRGSDANGWTLWPQNGRPLGIVNSSNDGEGDSVFLWDGRFIGVPGQTPQVGLFFGPDGEKVPASQMGPGADIVGYRGNISLTNPDSPSAHSIEFIIVNTDGFGTIPQSIVDGVARLNAARAARHLDPIPIVTYADFMQGYAGGQAAELERIATGMPAESRADFIAGVNRSSPPALQRILQIAAAAGSPEAFVAQFDDDPALREAAAGLAESRAPHDFPKDVAALQIGDWIVLENALRRDLPDDIRVAVEREYLYGNGDMRAVLALIYGVPPP